jgi:non-ribosomal peptide synthetase component F
VDFALWHEKNLKSSQVGSDLAWWKDSLAGATPTSKLLPFALHDRPEKASSERSIVRAIVKKADLKRMKRICSRVDVTPFHFLLAALRAFIYRYTSEEDLTLLVVNGDRPHPAFEGILGFFVNMIPLRWRGEFNGSFEDLLTEAKSLAIDSLAHSQAPFDSIVETMDMGWNPRHFPLGQIAVNYQMYAKSPKYLTKDFEIFDTKVDDIATACEIQLEAIEDPETGLDLRLEYDSFLYGEDDMARFFENFSTFIQSAINDFRQPIEEIEMCGPLEMRILRENCWTEELSSRTWKDQPLWVRFKEVARQHPEYIAIRTSTGETATYAELLSKAEETAAYFQGAGVRPGDRVGILGYPSIEVVAAMLSTSCLQCVYVPLDPDFAQQRLVYMIQDSKCSIVFFGPSMASLVTNLRDTTISSFLPLLTEAASLDQQLNSQDASSQDVFYIVYTSVSVRECLLQARS